MKHEALHVPAVAGRAPHRDNLLGVCAAIGEVTGIAPLIPRLALVAAMLAGAFFPVVIGYVLAAAALWLARR